MREQCGANIVDQRGACIVGEPGAGVVNRRRRRQH
jgi:hypothetical protein